MLSVVSPLTFMLGGGRDGGREGGGGGGEEATSADAEGTSTTLRGFPFLLASARDLSSDNVSCGTDGCGVTTDTEETLPRPGFPFLLTDACGSFGDATDTASEIGERANKFGFFFLPDFADITFAPKLDDLGGPTCPASSSSSIPPRGGESCITLELAKEEPSS